MINSKITLVGAGNMGGAMLSGWLKNGLPAGQVSVVDPAPSGEMASLLRENNVSVHADAGDLSSTDILLVAVKPQLMNDVLPRLHHLVSEGTLVISVAAGTTVATLEKHLGECACIRAMPNTPALIGEGMTVCYPNAGVNQGQRDETAKLLSAIGKVAWVDQEKQIDAVTAVSGSGPAYVFHLAECMAAAGTAEGLSAELSLKLAKQTIAGAGLLMRGSEHDPAQLRKNVTSPNGTTAAALDVLMQDDGLLALMKQAISAANRRAGELSKD